MGDVMTKTEIRAAKATACIMGLIVVYFGGAALFWGLAGFLGALMLLLASFLTYVCTAIVFFWTLDAMGGG